MKKKFKLDPEILKMKPDKIIEKYGKDAGCVIIALVDYHKGELGKCHKELDALYEALDKADFQKAEMLRHRFGKKSEQTPVKPDSNKTNIDSKKEEEKKDEDDPMSEEPLSNEPSKVALSEDSNPHKNAGRKKGTKSGDGIDYSKVKKTTKIIYTNDPSKVGRSFIKVVARSSLTFEAIEYVYAQPATEEEEKLVDTDIPEFGETFLTSSLAGILTAYKCQFGLPLYRIEDIFADSGFCLSRQLMAKYFQLIADELNPLDETILQTIMSSENKVVHCDGTPLQVIRSIKARNKDDPEEGINKKCTMAVILPNVYDVIQAAVYRFCVSKDTKTITELFKDYEGTLICDDNPVYDALKKASNDKVELSRCWFHARQRLFEVLASLINDTVSRWIKAHPEASEEQAKLEATRLVAKTVAAHLLELVNKLFRIEEELRQANATPSQILKRRKEESAPIVDEIIIDAEKYKDSPGRISDPASYIYKIKDDLKVFLTNPYVDICNIRCERGVKDFVMARKNFLFSFSDEGAKALGIIMTVIRTARINGLEPARYIAYYLEKVRTTPISKQTSILPWSETLPDELKTKGKVRKLGLPLVKN